MNGDQTNQRRCFVVMGFGTKTDLATGRKLDLDKSYKALIKPVVEGKGIICLRADEIPNSGSIDVPMYKELYKADVVVADLSTANSNAFYELGVRYGLRPRTTIVMSEDKLTFPFDVNHIAISKYTHLGDSIDYFEVMRFQKVLSDKIDAVLADDAPDSPVYTFLNDLIPPALKQKAEEVNQKVVEAIASSPAKNEAGKDDGDEENKSLSVLVSQGEDAIKNKQYSVAKALFNSAIVISNCDRQPSITSNNAYLYQRLAFATYKAEEPDIISALKEANIILSKLDLLHTNDSETVMLAAAIEKKLYENGQGDSHIDDAVLLYQRAYYLLNSRYNGINLAYLLNSRANSSLDTTDDERIADNVWANRIRKDVLAMCEKDWNALISRQNANSMQEKPENEDLLKTQETTEKEQKFWILVNKAEANFGLRNREEYKKAVSDALATEHEDWMMHSFTTQLDSLAKLLNREADIFKPDTNKVITPV